MIQERWRERRM